MDSEYSDRRRAGRLSCDFPVLLHSGGRSLRSSAVDLSRVGALIRVPLDELGLDHDIQLADLGRATTMILGDLVRADLHYEVLGPLVQHAARPVRLGRALRGQEYVELGLDFTEPITDMEAQALGIDLPALRDDAEATWIPQPAVSRSTNGSPAVTVVVCNERDASAPPLRIVPMDIDRHGLRADLGAVTQLPVLPEDRGAGGVLAMLADTYGGEPTSVLLIDSEPVWSGPIRFSAVEVCPYNHTVRLQVSFAHLLTERAMMRLGVA